eukprot:TRINITY_DN11344_c0_g1_i1.p1 TRINITY_DN11344_c0_g1~~TRINITY_DN11344_c0_g1_i1.p1  ORF type:complete len:824 (+),score=185.19 TRINITY_DN11344_c0_g1_i1:521-2992(+)
MPTPRRKKAQPGSTVGQALLRHRFNRSKEYENADVSRLHLLDGDETDKPVLTSVIERTDLQELLETAQLADRDFSATRGAPVVVVSDVKAAVGPRGDSEELKGAEAALLQQRLTIPRRPAWNSSMSADAVDAQERKAFLAWRRGLARLEENEQVVLTPFEKNMDFWRQLWRVLERSDLVVTVSDARNPLFYRCPDLEAYVAELHPCKRTLLLLNKADLLPPSARQEWATYFEANDIPFVFWSAKEATDILEGRVAPPLSSSDSSNAVTADDNPQIRVLTREELIRKLETEAGEAMADRLRYEAKQAGKARQPQSSSGGHGTEGRSGEELGDGGGGAGEPGPSGHGASGNKKGSHASRASGAKSSGNVAVDVHRPAIAGFVGHPNVGKSSTVNALFAKKKTGVTSTPGKTKHFQTLIMNDSFTLCDCPGLVFPSFARSKAEMVAAGVLPIDKLTDQRGAVEVVCERVPRDVLEKTYGLHIPLPKEHEHPDRPPTAEELLRTFALSRGQLASSGLPDETRASRLILKDYLSGHLPDFHLPPNDDDANGERLARVSRWPVGKSASGGSMPGGGGSRRVSEEYVDEDEEYEEDEEGEGEEEEEEDDDEDEIDDDDDEGEWVEADDDEDDEQISDKNGEDAGEGRSRGEMVKESNQAEGARPSASAASHRREGGSGALSKQGSKLGAQDRGLDNERASQNAARTVFPPGRGVSSTQSRQAATILSEESPGLDDGEEHEDVGYEADTSNHPSRTSSLSRSPAAARQLRASARPERAAHKLHRKAPRVKDRTWRAWRTGADEKESMELVRGVEMPLSYGAAQRATPIPST